MRFNLEYEQKGDPARLVWRLTIPETGSIRECDSIVPLVVAVYQEAICEQGGRSFPNPEVELFAALSGDFTDWWIRHAECEGPTHWDVHQPEEQS